MLRGNHQIFHLALGSVCWKCSAHMIMIHLFLQSRGCWTYLWWCLSFPFPPHLRNQIRYRFPVLWGQWRKGTMLSGSSWPYSLSRLWWHNVPTVVSISSIGRRKWDAEEVVYLLLFCVLPWTFAGAGAFSCPLPLPLSAPFPGAEAMLKYSNKMTAFWAAVCLFDKSVTTGNFCGYGNSLFIA